MKSRTVCTVIAICLAAGLGSLAHAATINIVNNDDPGEGFNDPTPVAPVGGNPGTTLGEQRIIVFETAARIWGSWIGSDVEIRVNAQFNDQGNCTTLGSTGAANVWRDFPNAPHPGTWYPSALADALAGYDLLPIQPDMNSTFNSRIDTAACSGSFYYGLDGAAVGSQLDLLVVVLHETAHGLGFIGFTNLQTGEQFAGFPDLFSWNLHDNTVDMDWNDMSNGERLNSITNNRNVVWTGASAAAGLPDDLKRPFAMEVEGTAPPSVVGTYPAQAALFSGFPPMEMPGEIELVNDGTANPNLGCYPLVGFTPGMIAMIDRGDCEFGVKMLNAENAGAVGAIVANCILGDPECTGDTLGDNLLFMGGGVSGDQVTIPGLFIGHTTGQTLRSEPTGVNVINRVLDLHSADIDGRPLMYTPESVLPGSSVNHWEVTPFPDDFTDLLMEPNISVTLGTDLDITPAQLEDVGHRLIRLFADGFEAGDTSAWTATVP